VEASGQTLRVAVIGYGLAGSMLHAPLVDATPGMEVAAIVTGNDERRAQAQREFPNAALLAHPADVWADAAAYDLAVVATANRAHAPLTLAALGAGLPVVVDKPMAANVDDARAMIAASRTAGLLLTVFHNRRWDADFLTVRRIVDEGVIGPPFRLESRFERYREQSKEGAWRELADPADAGGTLWDLGPHLVDQACVLFGDPTHVYAELDRRRARVAVDDDAFVALRFAGGQVAHLYASQVAALGGPRVRVSGLGGAYEQPGLDPQEDALRSGARPGDLDWGALPEDEWGRLVTGGPAPGDRRIEPERGRWHAFYAGVRDALVAGAPPPVDPLDGLRVVELIDAAHRSARDGTTVRLLA
jgi:scyllo-inositol 2-dehydrogenase (NADP+)